MSTNIITDDYIKKVLADHKKLLTAIHDRLLELYTEMEDSDGMIKMATFGGHENTGGGRSSDKKDLADIMLRHYKLLRAQTVEIRLEMVRLVKEQEAINRIWCCYGALEKEQKQILTDLYVKGLPYKEVQMDADMAGTSFERTRKAGMEEIAKLYSSRFTNVDIINNMHNKNWQKKKKKDCAAGAYEQMSLNIKM